MVLEDGRASGVGASSVGRRGSSTLDARRYDSELTPLPGADVVDGERARQIFEVRKASPSSLSNSLDSPISDISNENRRNVVVQVMSPPIVRTAGKSGYGHYGRLL